MPYQTDKRIHDFASFKAVTAEPRQVARLYFYAMVDPLIDLAYKVSCDFFKRPHIYTKLGKASTGEGKSKPLSAILAELRARSGSSEFFPSVDQRSEIYAAIFGGAASSAPMQDDSFPRLRDELIKAATAFAERAVDTGMDMLRERVRITVRSLIDYLTGLQGDSLKWSADEALLRLTEDVSYTILRNNGVAGVFGIATAPNEKWPYAEDSNADKLVEAISKQLASDTAMGGRRNTRESCSTLQRAAVIGAEAIALIAEFDERKDDNLDQLIARVYTWGSLLSAIDAERRPAPSTIGARVGTSSLGGTNLYNALTN